MDNEDYCYKDEKKERDIYFGDIIYEVPCDSGEDCNNWTCECAMRGNK